MNGITILSTLLGGGPATLIAKATLVLVIAAGFAIALHRASAAARHFVWAAALTGCVILALVSPVMPAIPLALAAPRMIETTIPTVATASVTTARRALSSPIRTESSIQRSAEYASSPVSQRFAIAESRRWLADHVTSLAVITWLVGCLLLLARCALGHLAVARLVHRSHALRSAEWDRLLVGAASAVGVRRSVTLLACDRLSAPITSGCLNSVILLPVDADDWSAERKRVVLVHELAHIGRLDYVTQLIAWIAVALFWFHPLVWLAVSRLRAEAEHAADDRVIAAGTAGVVYATHLLEIARAARRLPLTAAVAVGMVRSSRLEARFRALLDTTRSRAVLSSRVATFATSAAMAVMIPLAGLRAVVGMPRLLVVPPIVSAPASSVERTSAVPTSRGMVRRSAVDSTFEVSVVAHDGGVIRLEMPTGGGLIIHGWDESRARARVHLAGTDWRDVRVTLEPTGNDVRLRSRFVDDRSHSTALDFELWIPRRSDISLSSAGGSVDIDNVSGDITGHTGGGEINIRDASGQVTMETGGGDIRVRDSKVSGKVTTGWGRILVQNVTGDLRGSTPSGDTESLDAKGARVASTGSGRSYSGAGFGSGTGSAASTSSWSPSFSFSSAGFGAGTGKGIGVGCNEMTSSSNGVTTMSYSGGKGGRTITTTNTNTYSSASNVGATKTSRTPNETSAFSISKAGGDIELFDSLTTASVSTGGGNIFVALATQLLVASTGGGSIEVARLGGDANVWTGAGDVTLTVVNAEGSEHTIAVCSGRGQVVLELPAQLDAMLDLETAYTQNFERRTNIESDFSVAPSETTEWDDRMGTARKFVRASGRVGNGHGTIHVRTVNGDIIVRRRP